jgi:glycerol-3-phosphate acyltransferase PlsY
MDLPALGAVVAGYLIGSIDFGVIVPRLRGKDIYAMGSGNPGATNVLRNLGRAAAAAVLVGDLLKGVAAAAVGDLVGTTALGFAAGFAAVVGHCFPIWYRFRGGKGVAAAGGALFWLEPLLGLVLLAVWIGLVATTRRASIASLALAVLYVPGLVVSGHREWSLVWAGASASLIVVRHWGNIRRLISGAEHTIGETTS